jgi:hypothetical protein
LLSFQDQRLGNTADGFRALENYTTVNYNIALGSFAGHQLELDGIL